MEIVMATNDQEDNKNAISQSDVNDSAIDQSELDQNQLNPSADLQGKTALSNELEDATVFSPRTAPNNVNSTTNTESAQISQSTNVTQPGHVAHEDATVFSPRTAPNNPAAKPAARPLVKSTAVVRTTSPRTAPSQTYTRWTTRQLK